MILMCEAACLCYHLFRISVKIIDISSVVSGFFRQGDDVADVENELPSVSELFFVLVLYAAGPVVPFLVEQIDEVFFFVCELHIRELHEQDDVALLYFTAS